MSSGAAEFKLSNYAFKGPLSLSEIGNVIGCKIPEGSAKVMINNLAPLDAAKEGELSFLDNSKYIDQFKVTAASACIVQEKYANLAPKGLVALMVEEPYRAYAKLAQVFYPPVEEGYGIHPTAVVEKGAVIGKNVVIGPHSYIGRNVVIGDNGKIGHNVTIQTAKIGNSCIIHPGVRIGQDGFGFAMGKGGHYKVPQLGGVVIGNDVEIGANTTIDRGSGPDTIIGDGTKIDNLVQIAHNVEIGKFCVIVAQVGIAGSTKLGDYVVLGGKVGVNGHIKIGAGAKVAAHSGVLKDVEPGATIGGVPAVNVRDWHRQILSLQKLGKGDKE